MSTRTATLLGGLGRTLIVTGVLVLAFAGFQLWGTSVAEARAQSSLDSEFETLRNDVRAEGAQSIEQSDDGTEEATPPPLPQLTREQLPADSEAAGQLHIPAIGVSKTFVEGVSRDALRLGPGHYPGTPFPGQPGNAAIAGHRTTHGAPFFDIDKLVPGDEILVETLQGDFTYIVEGHDNGKGEQLGHFIVAPTNVGVIGDQGDNRITLTACHPKYSAQQRIIVTAILESQVAPANPPSSFNENQLGTDRDAIDGTRLGADDVVTGSQSVDPSGESETETIAIPTDGESTGGLGDELSESADGRELANTVASGDGITESLGWQPQEAAPTVLWGLVTAMLGLVAWAAGRVWKKWPAYILASPLVLGCLFLCFTHLDKFIPAV